MFPQNAGELDEELFSGNTLLYPHGQPTLPQPQPEGFVDPRTSIKMAQNFVQLFLESWVRNMLPKLLLRSKWFKTRQNLREGDYVIVLEPGLHNSLAPCDLLELAMVKKTLPGRDGLIQKVELRLSGQRKLSRPKHKLCLIATAKELSQTNK